MIQHLEFESASARHSSWNVTALYAGLPVAVFDINISSILFAMDHVAPSPTADEILQQSMIARSNIAVIL
jgi:hypothetical protein